MYLFLYHNSQIKYKITLQVSSSFSSSFHNGNKSFEARSTGLTYTPFTSTGSSEKNPDCFSALMILICPGYLKVFSTINGIFIVFNKDRKPSVLNASSVPIFS